MELNENVELQLPSSPEDFIERNQEYNRVLTDGRSWTKVPLLNYTPPQHLKDLHLVRFRGMVQDMQDPEIYLERYEIRKADGSEARIQEGKYRDCLVLKSDEKVNYYAKSNVHGERRTLFVVSLPGINDWAREHEEQYSKINLNMPKTNQAVVNNGTEKRSAPDDSEGEELNESLKHMEINVARTESAKKRQRKVDNEGRSSGLAAEYLVNSPIPERPSKACMVKVYDDFDAYVLNSIIDVVGFLSVDPALDASTMDVDMCNNDFGSLSEVHAQNPPPSLIPRLHAIAVHHLPHFNPLLDERLLPIIANTPKELNMPIVQQDLRKLLTLCLFNDELAADYLLSHLMSTVYSRVEMQNIGKFALNICNLPKGVLSTYTKKLYEILELLLPASHYLPMTLETLNTAAFAPKKDYATNKLVSGLLQLAPHTHLVLDETHMKQGKLEANGVLGIQNLAHLITQQQIKCNFQFYTIDYNVDIPVLVLSEGLSMLPSDFAVPIKTDSESVQLIEETLKAAHHFLKQGARLSQFRRFLTKSKVCTFAMNPEENEMIQNDFVEMRKLNAANSVDDLHALLVLSRLLAIARGKQALDRECWELAKNLEAQRKQRIKDLPKSSTK